MDNELLLLSKNDIPFIEAQINIHQPTINEIAFIGEETFFSACQILFFDKNKLDMQDKIGLENKTNFDIFMSIIRNEPNHIYKNKVLMFFTLIFPEYQFKFTDSEIVLYNEKGTSRINNLNFEVFKDILDSMFIINGSEESQGFNPSDSRAAKIAEKLNKGKAKVAKQKGDGKKQKVAVFSRYISILSVGLGKNMNDYLDYTVFQLKDEFKRFQLKQSFDIYLQAKMAGAQDLEEVDNWMDDIHS